MLLLIMFLIKLIFNLTAVGFVKDVKQLYLSVFHSILEHYITSFIRQFHSTGQVMPSAFVAVDTFCLELNFTIAFSLYRKSRKLERVSAALACCLEPSLHPRYKTYFCFVEIE